MNKTYRLVFNRALGVMQVASELTRNAHASVTAHPSVLRQRLAQALVAVLLALGTAPLAYAQQYAHVFEGENLLASDADYSSWGFIVADTRDGDLTITNGARVVSRDMILGDGAATTGTLTVFGTGSQLVGANGLYANASIGNAGNGQVNVLAGGVISNQHFWTLGNLAGTTGGVSIDGSGSVVTLASLWAGARGTGQVSISNGGRLSATSDIASSSNPAIVIADDSGSSGSLRVSGNGSLLEANASNIIVGNLGSATLAVTDGGTISSRIRMTLGKEASSDVTAAVSGAGSSLQLGGLVIGDAGSATLDVSDGATISARAQPGTGQWLNIGRGALVLDGTGTRLVSGGGSFWLGNQATMTIRNGATALLGGGGISAAADKRSTLLVTGQGSHLGSGADTTINVGSPGKASLTVVDGATASLGNLRLSDVSVASGAKPVSQSDVLVSGAGSSLTMAGTLDVGTRTAASFVAEKGASVQAATVWFESTDNLFGANTPSSFAIRDPGTVFTVSGAFNVSPHFNLSNGALLNTGSVTVRRYTPTIEGTAAQITGAQTRWNNNARLYTSSLLAINQGAQVTTGTLAVDYSRYLGNGRLSQSGIAVAGPGTKLTVTGTSTIGYGGNATPGNLVLSDGGELDAGDAITLLSAGRLAFGAAIATDADGKPVYAPAQAPGVLSPDVPLWFGPSSLAGKDERLLLNHTDNLVIANPMSSQVREGGDYDGIKSLSGTTHLTGDMSRFMYGVEAVGGRLIIDSDMNTGQERASDYADRYTAPQSIMVNGGELVLNGESGRQDIAGNPFLRRRSNAVVKTGGVLAGSGTIHGAVDIGGGGFLSPGDGSAAVFTVDGDLRFGEREQRGEATYNVDIRGNGASDRIEVSGYAQLNYLGAATAVAVTALDPGSSYQDGQSYTILNSGSGVRGAFSRAFSKSAFLLPTLSYTPHAVILGIGLNLPPGNALIVESGNTYTGNGEFDSVEVRSGGTLSPGAAQAMPAASNPATAGLAHPVLLAGSRTVLPAVLPSTAGDPRTGTVSATGPVSFAGGSFYDVDINGDGSSDRIITTGVATLSGGSVRVSALDPASSYRNGQSFAILSAEGGINGTFADVVSRSAFLAPSLGYTGNSAVLTIAMQPAGGDGDPGAGVTTPGGGTGEGDPTRPPAVFGSVASSSNQHNVAAALDTLPQQGQALALYNRMLMLSADEARAAYDALSGEIHASTRTTLLDDAFLSDGIASRLQNQVAAEQRSGVTAWVTGNGASGRIDSDGNAARSTSNRNGLMAGVDWAVADSWLLGAAIAAQRIDTKVDHRGARARTAARHFGLYAAGHVGSLSLHAGAARAWYDTDTRRHAYVPGMQPELLQASYDGNATTLFAELGWNIEANGLLLTPYLGLAHTRLQTHSGNERGSELALHVSGSKDELATATAGARATWEMSDTLAAGATLSAGLAWVHAGGDLRADNRAQLLVGGDGFTSHGTALGRNGGIGDLRVAIPVGGSSLVEAGVSGRFGNGQRDAIARLGWRVSF